MATLYKSQESQAARPAVTVSQAGQPVQVRGKFALTAAVALNDVFQLVTLPAGMVLEGFKLDLDPIDSNAAPTAIVQVGVLNAAGTALAGPVLLALTAAQGKAGGVYSPTLEDSVRVEPSASDRKLGVLIQTGAATAVAPTSVTTNKGKWKASTAYVSGDYITLNNGQVLKCTTGGTTGASQPEFDSSNAATTTDGTVTWTAARVLLGLTAVMRNQDQR